MELKYADATAKIDRASLIINTYGRLRSCKKEKPEIPRNCAGIDATQG